MCSLDRVPILTTPDPETLALRDQVGVLVEALFRVADARAEIGRALAANRELKPATVGAHLGRACAMIDFALTAVDYDGLVEHYVGTAPRCAKCRDTGTIILGDDEASCSCRTARHLASV